MMLVQEQQQVRKAWKKVPAAREAYRNIFCSQDRVSKVVETGFHVKAGMPVLSASHYGLATCSCHPERILEMKCPFKYQHGFIYGRMTKKFLVKKDRKMKQHHKYYYQMQLHMFVCDKISGDFSWYWKT